MSIYKVITETPRMIYCSYYHQSKLSTETEDYYKAIKSLHQQLQRETDKIEKAVKKLQSKILEKNTEMLVSVLSEYLQTPLKNDIDSIRNLISESLEKSCNQCGINIKYGVNMSFTGEVIFPETQYALLKRLEKSGVDYLKNFGLEANGTNNKVFESLFIVESSLNLDVIEYLFSKKIESSIKLVNSHKPDNSTSHSELYNLLYSGGADVQKLIDKKVIEIVIYFSKPVDIDDDMFNNSLVEALEKLWASLRTPYIAFMNKKLAFWGGHNFVLRLYIDDNKESITETLRWLAMYKEVGFLRQALIDEGKLIMKRLI